MKSFLRKAIPVCCILFLLSGVLFPAGRRLPADTLRVAFLTHQRRIHVKSNYGFAAVELEGPAAEEFEGDLNFVLTPRQGGIKIGDRAQMSSPVRIAPSSRKEFIRINGRRYRGAVVIMNTDRAMTAVNEVDVEGYLKGVLPMEISPRWPTEALKAQAVMSRTYAVNNLGKYAGEGYDLTADVFSQVYAGVEAEDSRSSRAVRETEGKVLIKDGSLARAYFHSSCGGHTEDIREVWGSDIEYFTGVYCPYCSDSPRFRWQLELSPDRLGEYLSAAGHRGGEIEDIKILSRTGSGRTGPMVINHTEGQIEITGHAFRMAVGPDIIKSALFTIAEKEAPFSFYGRGWGHGVGMCQWGARGQAQQGRDFRQILSYYMPGTQVGRWSY